MPIDTEKPIAEKKSVKASSTVYKGKIFHVGDEVEIKQYQPGTKLPSHVTPMMAAMSGRKIKIREFAPDGKGFVSGERLYWLFSDIIMENGSPFHRFLESESKRKGNNPNFLFQMQKAKAPTRYPSDSEQKEPAMGGVLGKGTLTGRITTIASEEHRRHRKEKFPRKKAEFAAQYSGMTDIDISYMARLQEESEAGRRFFSELKIGKPSNDKPVEVEKLKEVIEQPPPWAEEDFEPYIPEMSGDSEQE